MSAAQAGNSAPWVILIGPPGAGKSSVAAAIGAKCGLSVRDTDKDVEAMAGKSVADIFLDDGEPHFRDLERQAVLSAVAEHTGVVALGGGAVMTPAVAEALQGHAVVFLDVDLAHAAGRVGLNQARPLLVGNPRGRWQELMNARRPVYEGCATLRVSTSGRTVAEVAHDIIQWRGQETSDRGIETNG